MSLTVDADLPQRRKSMTLTRDFEPSSLHRQSTIKKSRSGTLPDGRKNRQSMMQCNDAGKFLMECYGVNSDKRDQLIKLSDWQSNQEHDSDYSDNESDSDESIPSVKKSIEKIEKFQYWKRASMQK